MAVLCIYRKLISYKYEGGILKSISDNEGNILTSIEYDNKNRVKKFTDSLGKDTYYSYNEYLGETSVGQIDTNAQKQTNIQEYYDEKPNSDSDLRDVVWNGSQYIAIGGVEGRILRSDDGYNWEEVISGKSTFRAVTWGNNMFVTVSWAGDILASFDGIK